MYLFIFACFYKNVLAAPHDFEMKDMKKKILYYCVEKYNKYINK